MHALVLCSSVGFTEGMLRLWEGMGMYEDVLRYYMEEGQEAEDAQGITPSNKVFTHLEMYGPSHPHLYPLVLRYLTSSPAILTRHKGELSKILAKIDEYQIMPPLGVVQLLSRNGVVDVGSVKEWLRGKVEENEEEIESVSGITSVFISRPYRDFRTNTFTTLIVRKLLPSAKLSWIGATCLSQKFSKSQSVQRAADNLICPVYTLCASTAITKGLSFSLRLD